MESMNFKIPATDLTFLWSGCKACFWAKHRLGWKRPYTPFPSVFNQIDKQMRLYWNGKPLSAVDTYFQGRNDMLLLSKKKRLLSARIGFSVPTTKTMELLHMGSSFPAMAENIAIAKPTTEVSIQLSGEMDLYTQNGLEGAVIDCKTSSGMTAEKALFYAPQQWVYRYALMHPANGDPWSDVKHLGLLVMNPVAVVGRDVMAIEHQYFPLPTEGLMPFLEEVAHTLAGPEPKNDDCEWCRLRNGIR